MSGQHLKQSFSEWVPWCWHLRSGLLWKTDWIRNSGMALVQKRSQACCTLTPPWLVLSISSPTGCLYGDFLFSKLTYLILDTLRLISKLITWRKRGRKISALRVLIHFSLLRCWVLWVAGDEAVKDPTQESTPTFCNHHLIYLQSL